MKARTFALIVAVTSAVYATACFLWFPFARAGQTA